MPSMRFTADSKLNAEMGRTWTKSCDERNNSHTQHSACHLVVIDLFSPKLAIGHLLSHKLAIPHLFSHRLAIGHLFSHMVILYYSIDGQKNADQNCGNSQL